MRKHLHLLTALILSAALILAALPAFAADSGADPLTLAELRTWLDSLQALAAESELYDDPQDPENRTEDGYAFVYDFGTLYYDRPELTGESVLRAAVVYDAEVEGPRGTNTVMTLGDLLACFYSENPQLTGTREKALIYWGRNLPEGSWWAAAGRDGQWVDTVQYAVHERLGDGRYTDAGLLFTLQQNTVVAIRAYGLDKVMTEEEVRAEEEELNALTAADDYALVPTLGDGSAAPFSAEDLYFLGLDFLTCTPEEATDVLGSPDADDEQNGLRVLSWTDCDLVFLPDARGGWQLTLVNIIGDDAEGPRCLRAGDPLSLTYQRFRFDAAPETNEWIIYGEEGSGSWGVGEFADDASATLRYGCTLDDGTQVVLMLSYEMLELSEITVYRVH